MTVEVRSRIPAQIALLALLALLALIAVGPAGATTEPDFHGLVSQGYLHSTDYNYMNESKGGSFAFTEMLFNMQTSVAENLRVGAQFMGRNLGNKGNEHIVLDWAFGDYEWRDELGVRIGKIKMPHGLYNKTRDVDMGRNTLFLPQSVYAENIRDILTGLAGVSVYGSLPLRRAGGLEYELFTGTIDLEDSGYPATNVLGQYLAKMYGDYLPMAEYRAEMTDLVGGSLIWNTPLEGLRLGASNWTAKIDGKCSFVSPDTTFSPRIEQDNSYFYVLSADYVYDRLEVACEFRRHSIVNSLRGVVSPEGEVIDTEVHKHRGGYYALASWQFTDWLHLAALYSMLYPDYPERNRDDPSDYMRDLGLTLRFDITDYWLIKVEGHAMQGWGGVAPHWDSKCTREAKDWTIFGLKSTFYF